MSLFRGSGRLEQKLAQNNDPMKQKKLWVKSFYCAAVLAALGKPESLITFVTDRPGHDRRYAIDPTKIHRELGWQPETDFDTGLRRTVEWYLTHRDWWSHILSGEYQNYFQAMYRERLGE